MRATGCFRTWTLASLLALSPTLASAEDAAKPYPPCDKTPTEGDTTAAKGAFQAGNGSFNEADYDRAINYWEDAYRRDCTAHPLLLNLARAYELNGQKHHAVTALQTFLARNPGSSEEGQIRRRIEKLEEQLRTGDVAPPAPTPTPTPATVTPTPAMPPPEAAPPPTEAPAPSGSRPIAPLIVASAGGAIAIVSGIVWLGALSDLNTFEKKCPNRQCDQNSPTLQSDIKAGNAAKSRADLAGGFTIAGVGIAAAGLIWYGVSKPRQTASAPQGLTAAVTPTFGLGYGGVQFDGRF
jgi:hypothetical protein